MGAIGGFTIDLILFGMIAAFLVLRLKSILGKRTGFERPPQAGPADRAAAGVRSDAPGRGASPTGPDAVPARAVPEPVSALGQTLAQMATIDRNFSPAGFLDGAEKAFEIIVHGFASGDRGALRPLLGEETWKAFDLAITERERPVTSRSPRSARSTASPSSRPNWRAAWPRSACGSCPTR